MGIFKKSESRRKIEDFLSEKVNNGFDLSDTINRATHDVEGDTIRRVAKWCAAGLAILALLYLCIFLKRINVF